MNKLTALIARHEGLQLKPYHDLVFKLSIGYGRNLSDVGISPHEAKIMLKTDVELATQEARKFEWFKDLNEPRQAVIVNMIFNMGSLGFKRFKKTIGFLALGEFDLAAIEMLDSKWSRQVGNRSTELSHMMETGEWQ